MLLLTFKRPGMVVLGAVAIYRRVLSPRFVVIVLTRMMPLYTIEAQYLIDGRDSYATETVHPSGHE